MSQASTNMHTISPQSLLPNTQPSYLWNFHILQNQRAFSALRVLSLTQGGVTLTSGSRGGLERKCQTPVSLLGMPQLGTRTHLKQNKSDNVNRRVDNSYAAGVTDSLHRETRWREARPWLNVVGAQPYKSLDLIIKLIIKKKSHLLSMGRTLQPPQQARSVRQDKFILYKNF